jgi:RimJ/RimL family protein N-acetyltransferase
MGHVPVLSAPGLVLRPARPDDVEARLALGSDPHIVHMFGGDPAEALPMTAADAVAWHDRVAAHPLAWVVQHQDRLLGHVRLDFLDTHDLRAALAIGFFDRAKLSQGIGRQVIALVLKYAFGPLHLHRVGVRVVAYNARAIRCYQACGFVVEGREREAALVGGVRHDDILMGILAGEFTAGPEQGVRPFTEWGDRRL